MKILITGASGFVGKNLKELLAKKYHLFTPNHQELELLDTVAVENYFKSHPVSAVIHCAVVGGSRKEEYIPNSLFQNLKIFFNIVRCKKYYKKLIFLGSGAEYDKSRSLIKVREDQFGKRIPSDDYSFYKYLCSKYIEHAENIVNLRIFGLYGKYEDYRLRFISNAICRNIFGLPIEINQNVYFDYLYVNDFVKIVDYFIAHDGKHKFYNIGTGKKIDLRTIAEKINLIANKKSKVIVKKKRLNKEYTCNASRLRSEIKNLEFTPFDQTLAQLYNWYKEIKSSIKAQDL